MADQLTPAERAEARLGMRDATDTFFKTIISYKVVTDTLDRFNEDRLSKGGTVYSLLSMVEYGHLKENDKFEVTPGGSIDRSTIQITMNVDYLDEQGLWNNTTNTVRFNGSKDELTVNGREYNIKQISYDAPLEARPVLVILYADPKQNKT